MTIWLVAIIRAQDWSEKESRDEQGATRMASCSVQDKQPVHLGTSCSCTLEWGEMRPTER